MHVQSLVLRKNNFDYSAGQLVGVPCGDQTIVEGVYWRIPLGGAGVQNGFKYIISQTKPRPDAVKALRVRIESAQDTYFVAITDTADVSTFTSRCDQCCGTNPVMPAVAIPEPIMQETGCPDADGNYNYFAITRPLGAGEVYSLTGVLNGAMLAAAPKDGFASLAALETWADANWSPATVTVSGNKVTLTSATGKAGSIYVKASQNFDSNAPAALTTGQKYTLNATVDSVALPALVGAANGTLADLAAAANADATYASYGTWSVNTGKIRLVTNTNRTSATLAVTIS